MKNQGNGVAKPSTENAPFACSLKCDEAINEHGKKCNSFRFCNEADNRVNCYLMDKPLNGDVEINNSSKCASYKKLGKYFRDEYSLPCLILSPRI